MSVRAEGSVPGLPFYECAMRSFGGDLGGVCVCVTLRIGGAVLYCLGRYQDTAEHSKAFLVYRLLEYQIIEDDRGTLPCCCCNEYDAC